jgi:hypothetical protein
MARQQKIVKEATFIARIQFKCDHRKVIYLARSSNGVDQHETTLFDGKATSCSCPSKKPCYHMKAAEAREEARWTEYRRELACKLAQQFLTVEIVEQIVEQQQVVETVSPKVEREQVWDKDLCCLIYSDNGEIVDKVAHEAKMKLQREAYEAEQAYRKGKVWDSVISEWVTPASENPIDHFASLKGTRVGRRKAQEQDKAQKLNEIAVIKAPLTNNKGFSILKEAV